MTDRTFALEVVRKLQAAGHTALWAGGCVRDELLGLTPQDYDVATSARPEQLRPLFKKRNEIGAHFGVVQVIGPRGDDREWLTVEVATFRSDGAYVDGRRPESVVFSSPEEDAQRRDFTVNGMFFDPVRGQLIDYVGGRADLDAKVLRAIGDPVARFTEDKLRILRAARMATRFDLAIEPATHAAARRMAAEVRVVSAERIAEELRKLLAHPNRARGLRLMRELALIEAILPEVNAEDVWTRAVKVAEALGEEPNPPAPFPGKEGGDGAASPPAGAVTPSGSGGLSPPSFPGKGAGGLGSVPFPLAFAAVLHELGPATAARVAERLKLSNAEATRLGWLVENHRVLLDAPAMRLSKLKPLLVHPGVGELLLLHRAEAVAGGRSLAHVEFCERVLRETPPEELNPPPVLTGEDLIALGLKPGPDFKRLLESVRAAQLEGQVTSKGQAVVRVRELLAPPPASAPPSE